MRLAAIVCATVCSVAVPAFCQEAQPAADENLSFREIQEMLDRFSDTTMRSIEEQLRTKLDEYENALEKSRDEEVVQPDVPTTYRLTFTVSGGAAPMSVLATPGPYLLNAVQDINESVESNSGNKEAYQLDCAGVVEPAPVEGTVRVEFNGNSESRRMEASEGSRRSEDASITFSGSANLILGKEQEIASNDELRVVLRVDEIHDASLAEQPATR